MALTYTWKITGLRKQDQVNADGETLPGAVVQTYWECHGTDANDNTAHFSGATPFSAENVPAGSFTAFADLTEEIVLGWVRNVVESDPSYMAHIEERIIDQIGQSTVQDAPMPWADEEVTPSAPLADAVPEVTAAEESANTAE